MKVTFNISDCIFSISCHGDVMSFRMMPLKISKAEVKAQKMHTFMLKYQNPGHRKVGAPYIRFSDYKSIQSISHSSKKMQKKKKKII